jgi:hypothetical protein
MRKENMHRVYWKGGRGKEITGKSLSKVSGYYLEEMRRGGLLTGLVWLWIEAFGVFF